MAHQPARLTLTRRPTTDSMASESMSGSLNSIRERPDIEESGCGDTLCSPIRIDTPPVWRGHSNSPYLTLAAYQPPAVQMNIRTPPVFAAPVEDYTDYFAFNPQDMPPVAPTPPPPPPPEPELSLPSPVAPIPLLMLEDSDGAEYLALSDPPEEDEPSAPRPPTERPPQPMVGFSRNARRQERRALDRQALRTLPLHVTPLGRQIIALNLRQWYWLPNGIATMQFEPDESRWTSNDISNAINWMQCGAYCHRSVSARAIGVENLSSLNSAILFCGRQIIMPDGLPPADYPRMDDPAQNGRRISWMRNRYIPRRMRDERV